MKIARLAASVVLCLGVTTGCAEQASPAAPTPPATASPAAGTSPATASSPAWTVEPRSERWTEVARPRLRTRAELVEVAADGPRRAWAVGSEGGADDEQGIVVVEQWDGTAWKKTVLDRDLYVTGFDVNGPGDMWIVGEDTLIHWDGRRWSYPRASGLRGAWFADVSIGDGRVVLVGTDSVGSTSFAAEWNGRTFEKRAGMRGAVSAVTARHGQVWAAGTAVRAGCSGIRPAVWHADEGGTYTEMSLPDVLGGYLDQVWEISPDDVWAVGGIEGERTRSLGCPGGSGGRGPGEALVMHWDGSSWQRVALPGGAGPLTSVTASGPGDVWAVGLGSGDTTVALHFDGRTWTRERVCDYPLGDAAVTAIPGTSEVWLVGAVNPDADRGREAIFRRQ